MSNKTIDMITIRQIVRLYATGRGTKYISQSTVPFNYEEQQKIEF